MESKLLFETLTVKKNLLFKFITGFPIEEISLFAASLTAIGPIIDFSGNEDKIE